jgi:hypothetical protein
MPQPEDESVDDIADDETFVANGVHADGDYLVPPLSPKAMSDIALGKPLDEQTKRALAAVNRRQVRTLGVTVGVNPNVLREAGWGVVFQADDPDANAMREALQPLLAWRKEQSGDRYREYVGDKGIPANSDGWSFLANLGSGTGQPVDPTIVSYYLTIVASAAQVSFDAQCAMDTQNAVGRLWFDGEPQQRLEALERYATSIVAREKTQTASPKRALFFAASNKGDKATNRSAKLLAAPVSKAFAAKHTAWDVASVIGEPATRKALLDALGSPEPPALLVTATHGAGFNNGDVRQLEHQGALVCQDWEGLASTQPLSEAEYVAAHDITNVALPGTVAFFFACYGAGTPKFDAFLPEDVVRLQQIAAGPFLSRLPQKLLLAGAAAVIGHVERAWTCSFQWPDAGAQTQVFKSLFDALAKGDSVGAAIEFFDQRCGAVSTQLVDETRQRKWGKQNDLQIGALWTAQMDARNYIVIGDPATRLST